MFYYISGALAHLDPSFAVIDAGGVGYKLTISQNTHDAMPPHLTVSEAPKVKLFTYMAVREDGIEMFGFSSEDELDAFKMLISVSGVGPKAAISILSHLTPRKLAIAICSEDKKTISKANGIGPKTAARIVLELKDKLGREGYSADETAADSPAATIEATAKSSNLADAQNALMVLGYSKSEAISALAGIDQNAELDDMIRLALKKLMR